MSVFLIMRNREIAKSDYELRHVCLSVHPSIHSHGPTQLPLEGFYKKFDIGVFLEDLSRKFKFP